jgi:hypothetical protein
MSNKGQNFLFGNLWFWELITAIGDSVLCIMIHVVKRLDVLCKPVEF